MQAAHTVCTYAPPYHQRCWLFNWTLITRWKVSLLFSPEDTEVCDFQQECQIWTRLTIEHFSTLKQSILNEPWPTGHDGASGPCSHMASFLHDRALVGICRWHGGLCFTDSGFWKYSWAHLVMSMTESCRWVMQCRLRARRPRASNEGLQPCPLRTKISPVSLNILMMLCTVDDEICKAFAIWHIPQSFYTLFHRLESLCPALLLRDSASLRHPFYS